MIFTFPLSGSATRRFEVGYGGDDIPGERVLQCGGESDFGAPAGG